MVVWVAMVTEDMVRRRFEEIAGLMDSCSGKCSSRIAEAARVIEGSYRDSGKLLIMGNGGSAADAQHMAGELISRFKRERKSLPAIALTTNTSAITAIANDYEYEKVFEKQVEGLCTPGDVVVGISTSGNSENVVRALKKARMIGAKTICLIGAGGRMDDSKLCDVVISVPSEETPRIQECHTAIIHIICELVEDAMFP